MVFIALRFILRGLFYENTQRQISLAPSYKKHQNIQLANETSTYTPIVPTQLSTPNCLSLIFISYEFKDFRVCRIIYRRFIYSKRYSLRRIGGNVSFLDVNICRAAFYRIASVEYGAFWNAAVIWK